MMHLLRRTDTVALPKPPVSVRPSGDFDGIDGNWSTFLVNVNSDSKGNNGQNFKVLISTSSPLTLLPAISDWCNEQCAGERGVLSDDSSPVLGVKASKNWKDIGTYTIPIPYWYSDDFLGINRTQILAGLWGKTNIGVGPSSEKSLMSTEQYAVKYTSDHFFMGSFGLAIGATGSVDAPGYTFLTNSYYNHDIASPTYGYTAGAWYRNNAKGVLGSLVLGGYDKSRMADTGLSLNMTSNTNNTLVVGIPSILYKPDEDVDPRTSSFTASSSYGFLANIDSTIPHLVLPDEICDKFQERFRLTYDERLNQYTVNSSAHEWNKQQNASVTFKITEDTRENVEFTNIQLPYAAFDLQTSTFTGEDTKNYFPIKKSKNGVYVLGRTFLQEAYIIVDYERTNFTVAPASNPDSLPKEDLKIIYNTTYTPGKGISSSADRLAPGAIAGTVVGIVTAFAIVGIAAFCWWKKRKDKREAERCPHGTLQIEPILAGQEIKYRRVSELTGSNPPSSPKTPLAGYFATDHKSIPPISEMSPDSLPVELYSPPPGSMTDTGGQDYFTAGGSRGQGAQIDQVSSGHNTPGTLIAELPGDEGKPHTPSTSLDDVALQNNPLQIHSPSDTSLSTNIDERLADHKQSAIRPVHPTETATTDEAADQTNESKLMSTTDPAQEGRRPSHQRGLSDTTIASDSTAISQPTPEEQERWAREPKGPLSK